MAVRANANADAGGDRAYRAAFTDWLACACAGADERAARAVRASGGDLLADVAFAATAGHVLDFDDTFADGVAHVSAASAPAALVLAAHLGRSLGATLDAYAEGYEAMAALAAASHPALYDAGWHPTAVCGPVGAAVAASRLLALPSAQRANAIAIALLRAGGTRGAFGSDGKSIQVGLAAAAGVQAALLARAGASVDPRAITGPLGFEGPLSGRWPRGGAAGAKDGAARAIERNWIKLRASCLGTHSPIEAAEQARERGFRLADDRLDVHVHPVARQAAHLDVVDDGLAAKIRMLRNYGQRKPPRVQDFAAIDPEAREQSRLVAVIVEESLPEFGTVLTVAGRELARVACPRGAPERPATAAELAEKVAELAGDRLGGVLDDLRAPADAALRAAGLTAARTT